MPTTGRPDLQTAPEDANKVCGTRHSLSDTILSPFIYGGDETKRGNLCK